jgi:hypothetical protein
LTGTRGGGGGASVNDKIFPSKPIMPVPNDTTTDDEDVDADVDASVSSFSGVFLLLWPAKNLNDFVRDESFIVFVLWVEEELDCSTTSCCCFIFVINLYFIFYGVLFVIFYNTTYDVLLLFVLF